MGHHPHLTSPEKELLFVWRCKGDVSNAQESLVGLYNDLKITLAKIQTRQKGVQLLARIHWAPEGILYFPASCKERPLLTEKALSFFLLHGSIWLTADILHCLLQSQHSTKGFAARLPCMVIFRFIVCIRSHLKYHISMEESNSIPGRAFFLLMSDPGRLPASHMFSHGPMSPTNDT